MVWVFFFVLIWVFLHERDNAGTRVCPADMGSVPVRKSEDGSERLSSL